MLQQQVVLNFDYLRPTQNLINDIVHDAQYIKRIERSKNQRRIGENVTYDAEKMGDFMKIVTKIRLSNLKRQKLLKSFIISFCLESYPQQFLLISTQHFLQKGLFILTVEINKKTYYNYESRISQSETSIYIEQTMSSVKKVYINALTYYFGIIKKHCFVSGKIDIKNLDFLNSLSKLFKQQLKLYKLQLLNPSSILSFSWKMVSAVADVNTIEKVQILKLNEYAKIQERIAVNQVEEQFRGSSPNLTKFWLLFKSIFLNH